ncbi:MAG: hypothetical protein RSA20_06100, partial [Oscillospiraceae bacterium]
MNSMEEEYTLADRFSLKEWKRIFAFLVPYKAAITVLIASAVITALFEAVFPLMTKYAINNFIDKKTVEGLVGFTGVFILFTVLQGIGSVIYSRK